MVNFPGRNGRRRRVLNEEVLAASSSHVALRARAENDGARDAPRYSDAAGVENHPQITDFVPRYYRTIALLLVTGIAITATLGALHHFAVPIAAALGMPATSPLDLAAAGSIAAWVEAVVLLMVSVKCMLIYSLRRHRINDFRGRYRVWIPAAAACLLASLNSVAGLHDVLASVLGQVTGWTALRAGAIWWLAIGGLPLGWIFLRTLLDAKECRLAGSLFAAAAICYTTGGVGYFGALSSFGPQIGSTLPGVALLLGHWMLLAAVVSYARFVVLDAQGLIRVGPRIVHPRKARKASATRRSDEREQKPAATPSLLSAGGYSRQRPSHAPQPAKPAVAGQWVDGSRPERDAYDDQSDDDAPSGDRKLSKAERKRLRKLKTQNRAA